ncbi:MAG: hypothetical protein EOP84_36105 [Verrucomicrobiaceae bacterium]|nr:MAG: hypothetical protein EOP84_36105 [Verrucomicrobiaceae bacterium]
MASNFDLSASEAVTKLEELFQRALPEDYKNWLLDPSAPYPAPAEVSIPDDSPWVDRIECFYAPQQILQELQQDSDLVQQGVPSSFPRRTLPIGETYSDRYLLSLRDHDFGAVLFLFHETADPYNEFQEGLYTLAPSFGS